MHWISSQRQQPSMACCRSAEQQFLYLHAQHLKFDCPLLAAGPLSNLAYALDKQPEVAAKVARVWWMGGALRVPGNVYDPQSDGSAEWNAFWVSSTEDGYVHHSMHHALCCSNWPI
jgi:purine nucleosidase